MTIYLPQNFALRFKMYPKMTVYFPKKHTLGPANSLKLFSVLKKGGWVRDVKVIAQTPIFSNHQKGYLDFSFAASSERCLCMTTHEWGLLKIETNLDNLLLFSKSVQGKLKSLMISKNFPFQKVSKKGN